MRLNECGVAFSLIGSMPSSSSPPVGSADGGLEPPADVAHALASAPASRQEDRACSRASGLERPELLDNPESEIDLPPGPCICLRLSDRERPGREIDV